MHSTVIKPVMNLNLSPTVIRDLVLKFEAIFGLQNAVAIFDANEVLLYGVQTAGQLPEYREIITINNQPAGSVALFCETADPTLQRALIFFAASLSQLAQESQRRDEMADEVLARYDELNLIYELGTKFAQGVAQEEIVQFVLMETNRIVQADAGVVYLWDSEKSNITPVSHFGNKSTADFWGGRLRELALSTLYAYDQAQLFEADRVICAPLRFNDELLGSLVLVYERDDKRFQASDINLLTTMTQNTALFIYVARLVAKLAHEKEELEKTLAELQATKDKLSQNERLSIVGQTVGSLIHDMRKPLSNVMGYAGLLQETDLTHEERFEFAGQIIKYIEVFSSMAQEVLDYTSGDAGVNKSPTTVAKFMT
ncbi:MAG: GAF domain-containing protein, partial [Anaerolineae bacterium]|nr:GAF domain-containing protein [Anaerolineae bacterium]